MILCSKVRIMGSGHHGVEEGSLGGVIHPMHDNAGLDHREGLLVHHYAGLSLWRIPSSLLVVVTKQSLHMLHI